MKLTIEEIKKKVVYLAHPYSKNPTCSFDFALRETKRLLDNGFIPFSPILHTHNFDISWADYHKDFSLKWIPPNYIQWDLSILKAMGKNVVILMSETAVEDKKFCSSGCEMEYQWAIKNHIPVLILEDIYEGHISRFFIAFNRR